MLHLRCDTGAANVILSLSLAHAIRHLVSAVHKCTRFISRSSGSLGLVQK